MKLLLTCFYTKVIWKYYSLVSILLIIKSFLTLLYTTNCKHSLVLLRMGEIIAWNMLNWLVLLIKLLLLHLIGCLYYCISEAWSHKHQQELHSVVCKTLWSSSYGTGMQTFWLACLSLAARTWRTEKLMLIFLGLNSSGSHKIRTSTRASSHSG
jgi:hypothetical protein